jgi:hypothetical protein
MGREEGLKILALFKTRSFGHFFSPCCARWLECIRQAPFTRSPHTYTSSYNTTTLLLFSNINISIYRLSSSPFHLSSSYTQSRMSGRGAFARRLLAAQAAPPADALSSPPASSSGLTELSGLSETTQGTPTPAPRRRPTFGATVGRALSGFATSLGRSNTQHQQRPSTPRPEEKHRRRRDSISSTLSNAFRDMFSPKQDRSPSPPRRPPPPPPPSFSSQQLQQELASSQPKQQDMSSSQQDMSSSQQNMSSSQQMQRDMYSSHQQQQDMSFSHQQQRDMSFSQQMQRDMSSSHHQQRDMYSSHQQQQDMSSSHQQQRDMSSSHHQQRDMSIPQQSRMRASTLQSTRSNQSRSTEMHPGERVKCPNDKALDRKWKSPPPNTPKKPLPKEFQTPNRRPQDQVPGSSDSNKLSTPSSNVSARHLLKFFGDEVTPVLESREDTSFSPNSRSPPVYALNAKSLAALQASQDSSQYSTPRDADYQHYHSSSETPTKLKPQKVRNELDKNRFQSAAVPGPGAGVAGLFDPFDQFEPRSRNPVPSRGFADPRDPRDKGKGVQHPSHPDIVEDARNPVSAKNPLPVPGRSFSPIDNSTHQIADVQETTSAAGPVQTRYRPGAPALDIATPGPPNLLSAIPGVTPNIQGGEKSTSKTQGEKSNKHTLGFGRLFKRSAPPRPRLKITHPTELGSTVQHEGYSQMTLVPLPVAAGQQGLSTSSGPEHMQQSTQLTASNFRAEEHQQYFRDMQHGQTGEFTSLADDIIKS